MAALTDTEVQATLLQAEAHLAKTLQDSQDADSNPLMSLALAQLRAVRIYSKSRNEIPALQGLGLKEALLLAESVNSLQPKTDSSFRTLNYFPTVSLQQK